MNAVDHFYGLSDEDQAARLTLLAAAASHHWDGGFTNLVLVKYRENAVFRPQRPDGQRIAVRIHRHGYHSDSALASELHWMRELGLSGAIEVPPILPAANGELTVRVTHAAVPEPRQVSILGWLSGSPVGTSESGLDVGDDLSVKLYFDAGALAATLHDQSCAMIIPKGSPATPGTRMGWSAMTRCGVVSGRPEDCPMPNEICCSRRVLQHSPTCGHSESTKATMV